MTMDEFDKIKELSEDIVGRKEPKFSEDSDDAENYHLDDELDKIPPLTALTETDTMQKYHFWGLGVAGLILVAVVGSIAFFGREDRNEQVPVIEPTQKAVRVKPENPGGMVIPDQDKMIYNRLAAKETQTKVEKLFPEPEKPVLPEILIKQNTPDPTFIEAKDIPAVNPLDTVAESAPVVAVAKAPANAPETLVLPKVEETQKVEVVPPKAEKAPMAKKDMPVATKKATEVWHVQLFSTSKKESAEKAWTDISKKQKALLSDMSHEIVAAEIPGKGTFYRVQAGQFATKDMASSLCAKLKAKKQDCVPVKNK